MPQVHFILVNHDAQLAVVLPEFSINPADFDLDDPENITEEIFWDGARIVAEIEALEKRDEVEALTEDLIEFESAALGEAPLRTLIGTVHLARLAKDALKS